MKYPSIKGLLRLKCPGLADKVSQISRKRNCLFPRGDSSQTEQTCVITEQICVIAGQISVIAEQICVVTEQICFIIEQIWVITFWRKKHVKALHAFNKYRIGTFQPNDVILFSICVLNSFQFRLLCQAYIKTIIKRN